jgi:hypothetical protein
MSGKVSCKWFWWLMLAAATLLGILCKPSLGYAEISELRSHILALEDHALENNGHIILAQNVPPSPAPPANVAADKTPVWPDALRADVAILQKQQVQKYAQMQGLQAQYSQLQREVLDLGSQISAKQKDAAAACGDEKKWVADMDALVCKPVPGPSPTQTPVASPAANAPTPSATPGKTIPDGTNRLPDAPPVKK